ncbi:site-specific integrase [Neptuniibacter sp.]|uniref:site-specific integrase n=1 Tax=Neptuniibacter sp. TaxID=1962643 RepID=UPI003B5C6AE1
MEEIRRSLSVNYASLGLMHIAKKISGISNPVQPSDRKGKTGRARRAKYVSFDDFMLFFQDRIEAGQDMAAAFLYIGYYLGLRPAEISGLDYELDINTGKLNIIVPHVKNTAKGKRLPKYQRGIDRVLVVDYNKELMKHIDIATVASQSDKDRIRRQIRDLNKRYFPHRKQLINMYSLRYTFGADVKRAARHDPIEVSSKLGHKNTKSSYCYGNSRQSLGKKKVPEATMQTKQQVQVDDSHTLLSLRDKLEQASESQAQKTKQDLPRV